MMWEGDICTLTCQQGGARLVLRGGSWRNSNISIPEASLKTQILQPHPELLGEKPWGGGGALAPPGNGCTLKPAKLPWSRLRQARPAAFSFLFAQNPAQRLVGLNQRFFSGSCCWWGTFGNVWRQMSLVVTNGGRVCSWHLVGWGQRHSSTTYNDRLVPKNPPKTNSGEVEKPCSR